MSQEINFTFNGSLVDPGDIFAETESSIYSKVIPHMYAIADYLKLVVGVLAIASDIYLIVIISKFQALKTRINNFILQFAIYNILFLLLANLIMILIKVNSIPFKTYFVLNMLKDLTLSLSFFVLTFMASDWFVSNYHPHFYERFENYFKYGSYIIALLVIIIIWIPVSILSYVFHENPNLVRFLVEETCFIFCFITIISIAILKQKNTSPFDASKTEYALTIPKTVFILASFIRSVNILFLIFRNDHVPDYFYDISALFFFIGEILFVASPAVVVYQLIKINKHFRSAYIKSCKKKWVHNYDDDDLDTDSATKVLASNVSFDKDAEAVVL